MRKRNCDKLFDNILWYTIYLFPIIYALVVSYSSLRSFTYADWLAVDGNSIGYSDMAFWSNLLHVCKVMGVNDGSFFTVVFTTFGNIPLGFNLPMFGSSSSICYYLSYFCSVYILHLVVDFLLFIPRLCHKWMNAFTRSDD